MSTKKYNPITPSLRYRITNSYTEITTDKPEKSLLSSQKRSGQSRAYRLALSRKDLDYSLDISSSLSMTHLTTTVYP